ncbi:putative major facilitator superfamily, sugar transporter (TC 2.A.1.1) family protein [Lyophyllum shimeji]|uniref:Major facilitator superfamily, sugar transporter (TC 2.A.1.1) family protein n=1 Tax=Lyophyllum shimeji TaxID=47721 RepID=A0A9P3PNH1_LYOSH|nr:putative major facilitator superfamily, sugar transporter (TC 2.A.1.1) family protein [Lyophyllum shimeji]
MGAADGVFKNIRVYYLAFIVYWGIVLFGYDTGIAGGVVSQPYFLKHFGLLDPDGKKNVKRVNDVSSILVSVLQGGAFFGALGSAPISSWIGRRWTLVGFTAIFSVGAILTTVADEPHSGLKLMYAGRVISGLGIGGISAVAPAYVSECSPKEVRGRITGLFQIMVAVGVMISYFINFGISEHVKSGVNVWRIPFGFQLVPAGIMLFGLLTVKESPRWLASVGRKDDALRNLAYLRNEPLDSHSVAHELAEIEAQIEEERAARAGLGVKEAFLGKGNFIRFVIAFVIFLLQQWGGQNSVGYYAPQIFTSIGYTGTSNSLLASGIYGIVKVVATAIFVFFMVESLGRRLSLIISSIGMGTLFFMIGAILKTHPPVAAANPPPASKAMAALLYIYVCFYSMGWGPLPWVYVSDIFPTRTRHYGLATASASQWLWNFVVSKVTPDMITNLGWKIFIMFGTVNIGAMATFSLCVPSSSSLRASHRLNASALLSFSFHSFIPETKGRSLEDMDIIFGSISAEKRAANVAAQERAIEHEINDTRSVHSVGDNKV